MTGDPGYSSAVIEVPQAEAAAGTSRTVWSPTHGPLTVDVPPGTVDGAVVWVQSPTAGNVAVTVRVSSPFPTPAPYPGAPSSGVPAAASGPGSPPPPDAPVSGPGQPPAGASPSGPGYPPPGAPASGAGYPPPGGSGAGYPPPGAPASGPGYAPASGAGYPPPGAPGSGPGYPPPGAPGAGGPGYPGQAYPGQSFPGQPGQGYPGQPQYAGQPQYLGQPQYPGQPGFAAPAKPSNTRRNSIIGGTLAVVLALGCCGVVRVFSGDDDTKADKRTSVGGGNPAPTTAAPLTPQQYGQTLAAADSAIGASFRKLNTSDSAAFAKVAPAAATTIRAEADKLRAVKPPAAAASAHGQLAQELESLGDMVDESASAKQECPAASPWASVLQSGWADGIRQDAKRLAATDPAYKFGTFLPAAPKETNRRLKTGTFLKRPPGGSGHLKIRNGAADTTVSLVPTKGKKPKPILTVYVRGGGTFTAKGVRDGTYRVFTASGKDWNKSEKGFTRDCNFSKFDDTFKFSTTSFSASIWTITLTPVIGGNASTSDVDPKSFPN